MTTNRHWTPEGEKCRRLAQRYADALAGPRGNALPGLAGVVLGVLAILAALAWAGLTLTAAIVSSLTIGLVASGTALAAATLGLTALAITRRLRQEDENR